MSAQNVIIGTMTGLAAGVLIGVLLAPAPGRETRQMITDAAGTVRRRLRNLKGASSEELQELIGIFERAIQGLQDDVRRRVLQLIKTSGRNGHPAGPSLV